MIRRLPLFLVVFSCLAAAVGEAQIGETESELVARLGAVQSRQVAHVLVEGRAVVIGERLLLRGDDWRVKAVMIAGRCAVVTYTRRGPWTEADYRGLLAVNAGPGTWHEIVGRAPKWQRTWRRSDGLVAKWMYATGFIIESHAFVQARDDLRAPSPDLAGAAAAR